MPNDVGAILITVITMSYYANSDVGDVTEKASYCFTKTTLDLKSKKGKAIDFFIIGALTSQRAK